MNPTPESLFELLKKHCIVSSTWWKWNGDFDATERLTALLADLKSLFPSRVVTAEDAEAAWEKIPTPQQFPRTKEYWAEFVKHLNYLHPSVEAKAGSVTEYDGNWMDKWGACKVCGGEIPHGHSNNCDIYKLEQRVTAAEKTAHEHQPPTAMVGALAEADVRWACSADFMPIDVPFGTLTERLNSRLNLQSTRAVEGEELTPEEKDQLRNLAKLSGLSIKDYLRAVVVLAMEQPTPPSEQFPAQDERGFVTTTAHKSAPTADETAGSPVLEPTPPAASDEGDWEKATGIEAKERGWKLDASVEYWTSLDRQFHKWNWKPDDTFFDSDFYRRPKPKAEGGTPDGLPDGCVEAEDDGNGDITMSRLAYQTLLNQHNTAREEVAELEQKYGDEVVNHTHTQGSLGHVRRELTDSQRATKESVAERQSRVNELMEQRDGLYKELASLRQRGGGGWRVLAGHDIIQKGDFYVPGCGGLVEVTEQHFGKLAHSWGVAFMRLTSPWRDCLTDPPTAADADENGDVLWALKDGSFENGLFGVEKWLQASTHWMPIPRLPPLPVKVEDERTRFEKWMAKNFPQISNVEWQYEAMKTTWLAAMEKGVES